MKIKPKNDLSPAFEASKFIEGIFIEINKLSVIKANLNSCDAKLSFLIDNEKIGLTQVLGKVKLIYKTDSSKEKIKSAEAMTKLMKFLLEKRRFDDFGIVLNFLSDLRKEFNFEGIKLDLSELNKLMIDAAYSRLNGNISDEDKNKAELSDFELLSGMSSLLSVLSKIKNAQHSGVLNNLDYSQLCQTVNWVDCMCDNGKDVKLREQVKSVKDLLNGSSSNDLYSIESKKFLNSEKKSQVKKLEKKETNISGKSDLNNELSSAKQRTFSSAGKKMNENHEEIPLKRLDASEKTRFFKSPKGLNNANEVKNQIKQHEKQHDSIFEL